MVFITQVEVLASADSSATFVAAVMMLQLGRPHAADFRESCNQKAADCVCFALLRQVKTDHTFFFSGRFFSV